MTDKELSTEDNLIFEAGGGEIARLTLQSKVIKYTMGKLVLAPVDLSKTGLRILDQACADGLWLRDVAAQATAQHEYVGTDIVESYFPTNPPPNFSYRIQSMNDPFPEEWKNTFDLVHSRFSLPAAGKLPMTNVIASEIGVLKPGGWLQHMEMHLDGYENIGPAMKRGYKLISDVFDAVGAGHTFSKKIKGWMEEANLEDVHTETVTVPIGARQKDSEEIARDGARSMSASFKALSGAANHFPAAMSLSKEEIENLSGDALKELTTIGGEWRFLVVMGRKPF